MTIVVIDGMGGGIGAQIIERVKRENYKDLHIVALGANAIATQRMIEAGADKGASGENAVRVSIDLADVVMGPIGIIFANAMLGEISPTMAEAIINSRGKKILLPVAQSHITIVGLEQKTISTLVDEAIEALSLAIQAAH
jgi:hypothetical protein